MIKHGSGYIDAGFGDVDLDRKKEVPLERLKKSKMRVRPMFLDVADVVSVQDLKLCQGCVRAGQAGPSVEPIGSLESPYVFVGRDPGEQEVENGQPFWPEAPGGKLLMEYLEILGLLREQVYITNAVFCRAPGNAEPTPEEFMACLPYHKKEFESLTGIKWLFPLGTHAFQLCTGIYGSISPYVGSYFETVINGREVTIIPIHHPGYLLRNEVVKAEVYRILESITLR
jgi:DNA polymerase